MWFHQCVVLKAEYGVFPMDNTPQQLVPWEQSEHPRVRSKPQCCPQEAARRVFLTNMLRLSLSCLQSAADLMGTAVAWEVKEVAQNFLLGVTLPWESPSAWHHLFWILNGNTEAHTVFASCTVLLLYRGFSENVLLNPLQTMFPASEIQSQLRLGMADK